MAGSVVVVFQRGTEHGWSQGNYRSLSVLMLFTWGAEVSVHNVDLCSLRLSVIHEQMKRFH